MNKKWYRAKVNGLYVRNVSVFSRYIEIGEKEYSNPKYLNEEELEFLLKIFPEAEIKTYSLMEKDSF